MTQGIIFGNRILDVVFIAWFLAQAYKVVQSLIIEKRVNFRRFIESGGMPSSHSSSVMSLVTAVGIAKGTLSIEFAISILFAIIVMYDAAGVRRAAGKQAEVLNKIADNIAKNEGHQILEKNLKELIGHTPFEVVMGAILGIVISMLMQGYILN